MIYLTGDTHGDFERIEAFCERAGTSKDDILIILGDAGFNYYGGWRDRNRKVFASNLPITLFCIHGNHEMRPETLEGYTERQWHEGMVYVEHEFPSILFAKDGEIFNFDGRKTLVIGGAYSVDKYYRLERGFGWWADEQPSQEIRNRVEQRLEEQNWRVDTVLSHTAPLRYEPTEVFLPFIDQSSVDKSTEMWLDEVESRLVYKRWFCGHFHIAKRVDKLIFMFEDYREWSESDTDYVSTAQEE